MKWIFIYMERNLYFISKALIQTSQQSSTSCKPNTILHDICI